MADIDAVMGRIKYYMETAAPKKKVSKPKLVRHRRPLGKWATKPVNRTSKVPKPTSLLKSRAKLATKPATKKAEVKKPAALTKEQIAKWKAMSPTKQREYLKKHPNSQFKKLGVTKKTKPKSGAAGGTATKKTPPKRANAAPKKATRAKTDKEKSRAKKRTAALGNGGMEPGSKERAESSLAVERDGPNVLNETLSDQDVQDLDEDVDDLRERRTTDKARRRKTAMIIGGMAVAALLVVGLSTVSPGLSFYLGSQMVEKIPDLLHMALSTEAAENEDANPNITALCKAVGQYVNNGDFPDDLLNRLVEEANA